MLSLALTAMVKPMVFAATHFEWRLVVGFVDCFRLESANGVWGYSTTRIFQVRAVV